MSEKDSGPRIPAKEILDAAVYGEPEEVNLLYNEVSIIGTEQSTVDKNLTTFLLQIGNNKPFHSYAASDDELERYNKALEESQNQIDIP